MSKNDFVLCNQLNVDSITSAHYCTSCAKSSCGCSPSMTIPSIDALLSTNQFEARSDNIEKVKGLIKESKAALVLGAGVSIPAGMPNWYGLVSQMMGYSIQYKLVREKLQNQPPSCDEIRIARLCDDMINGDLIFLSNTDVLESGEYVAQYFDDPDESDKMRLHEISMKIMVERMLMGVKHPVKMLIEACENGLFGPDISCLNNIMKKMINEVESNSFSSTHELYEAIISNFHFSEEDLYNKIAELSTISAVAFLVSSDKGIKKAMTYNYDPIVELYTRILFDKKVKSYNGDNSHEKYSLIDQNCDLFHLHGFVPGRFACMYELELPKCSDRLILSEDSYYAIEKSGIYSFTSRIQANFLDEMNCLFVGFSATDYNFKRILRQIGFSQNEVRHYMIYTIDDVVKNTYQDICRYHMNKSKTFEIDDVRKDSLLLLQQILDSKCAYWHRFGIVPIWTTVAEIPELLVSFVN